MEPSILDLSTVEQQLLPHTPVLAASLTPHTLIHKARPEVSREVLACAANSTVQAQFIEI